MTIGEKVYSDVIRGCGYHYDDKNWDYKKNEFVDFAGYGKGCFHSQTYGRIYILLIQEI